MIRSIRIYREKKSELQNALRNAETTEERDRLQEELRRLKAEFRSQRKGLPWLLF